MFPASLAAKLGVLCKPLFCTRACRKLYRLLACDVVNVETDFRADRLMGEGFPGRRRLSRQSPHRQTRPGCVRFRPEVEDARLLPWADPDGTGGLGGGRTLRAAEEGAHAEGMAEHQRAERLLQEAGKGFPGHGQLRERSEGVRALQSYK